MEDINLNKKELEKFFKRYDYTNLENLKGLMQFACSYNTKEADQILDEVQREKQTSERDFYDYTYKAEKLSDKELKFLHNIVEDAHFCYESSERVDFTKEADSSYCLLLILEEEEEKRKSQYNKEGLSKEELYRYFDKYNAIELESFETLLTVYHEKDRDDVIRLYQRVYKEKTEEADYEYFSMTRHIFFPPSNLRNKNRVLNDKELKFITDITSNTINCYVYEGFREPEVIEDLYSLMTSLTEEKEKRKQKVNTK